MTIKFTPQIYFLNVALTSEHLLLSGGSVGTVAAHPGTNIITILVEKTFPKN